MPTPTPLACTLHVRFVNPDAAALYATPSGVGLAPASTGAAGLDLRACLPPGQAEMTLAPGARALVPAGIAMEPLLVGAEGLDVAGFIYSRSGLGAREGLAVAQGVGVVDADYRGEILVMLLNTSAEPRTLRRGERMAQLVLHPVLRPRVRVVDTLGETARGAGGFGHTGKL